MTNRYRSDRVAARFERWLYVTANVRCRPVWFVAAVAWGVIAGLFGAIAGTCLGAGYYGEARGFGLVAVVALAVCLLAFHEGEER